MSISLCGKKDAMALVTGKPVFLEDQIPAGTLVVKLLRSPHANALVEEIHTEKAKGVPGVEAVYTWEDVPGQRFTMAGQTYPEPSPYDRLILDRHVRYVGDPVAIVAAETEAAAEKALKLIKVTYQVLPALLDFRQAKDNELLVHPEEDWKSLCPVGADNKRNLCASGGSEKGDVEQVLADCPVTVEGTYHTLAAQQSMMETFRTYCSIDTYGRLNVVSSTQIVFHVRRILSNALGIPKTRIRVTKARIGGGFGAKQTVVAEVFPAFVTWMTKKPSRLIFTREESMTASSPRHEMEVKVRVGAGTDGRIRAIDVHTLSNTGAYGEHGPPPWDCPGQNLFPCTGTWRPTGLSMTWCTPTSCPPAPTGLRGHPGDLRCGDSGKRAGGEASYGSGPAAGDQHGPGRGCDDFLRLCPDHKQLRPGPVFCQGKGTHRLEEKYPAKDLGNGKIRSVGLAMGMQGSGISGVDVGSATLKLNDDGGYMLSIGSADMGTGCDTILAQIAAECLDCELDQISVSAADTDTSPYDSGSYASSTTYITGKAVEKAGRQLRELILEEGSRALELPAEELEFDGRRVYALGDESREISLVDIATRSMCGNNHALEITVSNSSPISPPPFMAGAVEIELDKETGEVRILNYAAVVDCGTPINPNLARIQVEGGLVQAMGMTLFENIQYSPEGKLRNNSFMQYKIPTRLDMGKLQVEFQSSYEPTGPFGAKSIGEIVINTPAPALVHAIANATGCWFHSLPATSEKIAMAVARGRTGVIGDE